MTTIEAQAVESAVESLVGRLFGSGVAAIELCNAYLGVHLGLYRALADEPATPAELADRVGCDERYLREWLQAQAVSGFALIEGDDHDDPDNAASARYALADGVAETLVHETSPAYLGGLADALAAAATVLPQLLDAYRSGNGVPYAAYGPDAVTAQAALNRPSFANSFVADWLPQLPDVLARLSDATRPARVADLGCGVGWAGIELAKAFPHIEVDGRDNDEASIAMGRRHAVEAGVADRVTLEVVDISDSIADWSPRFDFAFFVECVHDFPRPVEALRNARAAVRPGGTVLVVDELADETFRAPGDQMQRFFAAASAIWCLPQGRVGTDPEPVGALIRPDDVRDLARRAGYSAVDIVPIEHPCWRFYRLTP
jgi:SAM-dependent methyltransferase